MGSAPSCGKSFRSSARTCCAVEPWASHPAPERTAERDRQRCGCEGDDEPDRDDAASMPSREGCETREQSLGIRAPRRGGSFGSACSWQSCQAPRQLGPRRSAARERRPRRAARSRSAASSAKRRRGSSISARGSTIRTRVPTSSGSRTTLHGNTSATDGSISSALCASVGLHAQDLQRREFDTQLGPQRRGDVNLGQHAESLVRKRRVASSVSANDRSTVVSIAPTSGQLQEHALDVFEGVAVGLGLLGPLHAVGEPPRRA